MPGWSGFLRAPSECLRSLPRSSSDLDGARLGRRSVTPNSASDRDGVLLRTWVVSNVAAKYSALAPSNGRSQGRRCLGSREVASWGCSLRASGVIRLARILGLAHVGGLPGGRGAMRRSRRLAVVVTGDDRYVRTVIRVRRGVFGLSRG